MTSTFKLFLTFLALCLSACVQTPQTLPPEPTRKSFTSISTQNTNFVPKAGQSFAWYSPPITWATTGPTYLNDDIEAAITTTVEQELANRGYVITQDSTAADFIIGMVLSTDDYNHANDFAQYFNLNANINSDGSAPVVNAHIGVVDGRFANVNPPPSQALVWKADLETEILAPDTDKAIRIARAKTLTKRLLSSLPSGK
ncbi:MAG TPA: DUF4136 domain-containing protein [Marinagarivorans sp.]